jgi:hypothetical protein
MLSKKTKGLFLEVNGFSYHLAAVTSMAPPLTVENLFEFSRQEPEQLRDFISRELSGGRTRFLNAHCGVVPESRFFRLHTLESIAKARDQTYFFRLLEDQFHIKPETSKFSVLSAFDGAPFDPQRSLAAQKELIFCGAELAEFDTFQRTLVDSGIYPSSLQLSTLSSLAALKHYLGMREISDPVLLVELSQNSSNFFILTRDKVDLCRPVNSGINGVLPVIREELGLKDEDSARDLFYSNTFDFREIGPKLLSKVLKELNSSAGFYEVQTGQTIPYLYMTAMPDNLGWIPEVVSNELQIQLLDIDWMEWARQIGVSFGDDCSVAEFGPSKFGLFSLLLNFNNLKNGAEEEK